MDVQVTASAETWSWNAVAYAVSQVSTTWEIVAVAPRSTCSHCGSLAALDQRVPALPSTAAEAGVPAFSTDEAVAGFPWDSRVVAALATVVATTTPLTTRVRATANAIMGRRLRMVRSKGTFMRSPWGA